VNFDKVLNERVPWEAIESGGVSVTLRNLSVCVLTRPTTQLAGPLACTIRTLIGSLKSEPVRIWPGPS